MINYIAKFAFVVTVVMFSQTQAWEGRVTQILQHGSVAAVYISPAPGKGQCENGGPYILHVDGSPENNQRFSMLMMSLSSGMTISGYDEACSSAIWGQPRPTIGRLYLKAP